MLKRAWIVRTAVAVALAAALILAAVDASLAIKGPAPIRCGGQGPAADGDAGATADHDHDGDDLPPCPVQGRTVLIAPLAGVVTYATRPGGAQARLSRPTSVPVGTVVDALRGHFRLTADERRVGIRFATSDFYGGRAQISQNSGPAGATVTMHLTGAGSCRTGGLARAAAKGHHAVSHLWGNGKGHFSTSGHYAAAIVQGTRWLVTDYCDGSNVTVRRGLVAVRDLVTGQAVAVPAGEQVFAQNQPRPKLSGDSRLTPADQVQMTSTGQGFGLVSIPMGGRVLSSLQQLSLSYRVLAGTCTNGSPRFQLHLLPPGDNNPQDGVTLFAYLGSGATDYSDPSNCPSSVTSGDQPNVTDPGDSVARWQVSQQTGPITYASVLAQFSDYRIVDVQVAVDAGFLQGQNVQQILLSKLQVNGWSFFAPLVPTAG